MSAVHSPGSSSTPPTRLKQGRGWIIAIAVTVVVLLVLGVTTVVVKFHHTNSVASAATDPAAARATAATTVPLTVTSTTPVNGATGVPSDATLSVQFSDNLSSTTPLPTIPPPVPGTWQALTPSSLVFVPTGPIVPSTTETVTVPGGSGGVESAAGKVLAQPVTVQFTTAPGSVLRLQQLLAQLNYLPLSFTPSAPLSAPQELAQPQAGSFAWRWTAPSYLAALWVPGSSNTITRGAVMAFENQHNLKTDGIAGPAVWTQLLTDAQAGTVDPSTYNYVYVRKSEPETATVYQNGVEVYSTLANTGVAGAPTADGTFPVYSRFKVTTMTGTNPDGTKYSDPGIPWVSYFNGGDALHGFVRGSYGYPQSDGCVEMPPAHAAVVFPYTPIGTLVTVA